MKLNKEQLDEIERACNSVDYGAVTIKLNRTAKYVDIVVEKQIRINNEPTVNTAIARDKKY